MADGSVDEGLEQVIDVVISGYSEQGYPGYSHSGFNQDAHWEAKILDEKGNKKYAVGIVADGVSHGGYGEIAAQLAVNIVSNYVLRRITQQNGGLGVIGVNYSTVVLERFVTEALDVANEAILAVRESLVRNGGVLPDHEPLFMIPTDQRKDYFSFAQPIVECALDNLKTVINGRKIILGQDKVKVLSKDEVIDGVSHKAGESIIRLEDVRLSTALDIVIERYDPNTREVDTVIGHVGDTRTYLRTDSETRQLTRDHRLGEYFPNPLIKRNHGRVISGLGHDQALLDPSFFNRQITSDDGTRDVSVEFGFNKYQVVSIHGELVPGQERLTMLVSDGVHDPEKGNYSNGNDCFVVPFFDKARHHDHADAGAAAIAANNIAQEIVRATMKDAATEPVPAALRSGFTEDLISGTYHKDDTTAVVIRSRLIMREPESVAHTGQDATPPNGVQAIRKQIIGYSIRVADPTTNKTLHDPSTSEPIKGYYSLADLCSRGFGNPVLIGRDGKKSHLVVSDPRISGVHVSVYGDPATRNVFLEDCDSKNGTFVVDDLEYRVTDPVNVSSAPVTFILGQVVDHDSGGNQQACKLEIKPVYEEDQLVLVGYRVIITNSDDGTVVREARYTSALMRQGVTIGSSEHEDIHLESLVLGHHGVLSISGREIMFRIDNHAITYNVDKDLNPDRSTRLSGRQTLQFGQYINLDDKYNLRVVEEYGVPDPELKADYVVDDEVEVAVDSHVAPPPSLVTARNCGNGRRQIGDLDALAERRQVQSPDGLVLQVPQAYAARQEEAQQTTRLPPAELDAQEVRTVITNHRPGSGAVYDGRSSEQRGDHGNVLVAPEETAAQEEDTRTRTGIRLAPLAEQPLVTSQPANARPKRPVDEITEGDNLAENFFRDPRTLASPTDLVDNKIPVGHVEKEPFYRRHPIVASVALCVVTLSGLAYAILTRDNSLADRLKQAAESTYQMREPESESPRERSPLETTATSYATKQRPVDPETAYARRAPDASPYAAETVDGFTLTPVHAGGRLFYFVVPQEADLTVDQMVAGYNAGKGDVCAQVTLDDMRLLDADGKAYHLSEGTTGASEVKKDQRFISECKLN